KLMPWLTEQGPTQEEAAKAAQKVMDTVNQVGVHVRIDGVEQSGSGAPWADPHGQKNPRNEMFVPIRKRWIDQHAQERGDMHDVRAVMHLLSKKFPEEGAQQLRVIVHLSRA